MFGPVFVRNVRDTTDPSNLSRARKQFRLLPAFISNDFLNIREFRGASSATRQLRAGMNQLSKIGDFVLAEPQRKKDGEAFFLLLRIPLVLLFTSALLIYWHNYFVAGIPFALAVVFAANHTIPAGLRRLLSWLIVQSRYAEAESLAIKSLHYLRLIRYQPQRSLPRSFSWDILIANELALALLSQGKYEASAIVNEKSIEILENAGDSTGMAALAEKLAYSHIQRGDLERADGLTSRSMMVMEAAYNNAKKNGERTERAYGCQLLTCMFTRATLFETKREFDKAEPLRRRALELAEVLYGKGDLRTTPQEVMLGSVLMDLGKTSDAEQHLRNSFELRCASLPATHSQVASVKHKLGKLYCRTGRLDEAEPLLTDALNTVSRNPDFADVPSHKATVAELYIKQQRFAEAEKLLVEALQRREQLSGRDHPELLEILEPYAELLHSTERLREAQEIRQRIDSIRNGIRT